MSINIAIKELDFKNEGEMWFTETSLYICFILIWYLLLKYLWWFCISPFSPRFKQYDWRALKPIKERAELSRLQRQSESPEATLKDQTPEEFQLKICKIHRSLRFCTLSSLICATINITSIMINHTLIISASITRNCILSRLPVISILFQRWSIYSFFTYRIHYSFGGTQFGLRVYVLLIIQISLFVSGVLVTVYFFVVTATALDPCQSQLAAKASSLAVCQDLVFNLLFCLIFVSIMANINKIRKETNAKASYIMYKLTCLSIAAFIVTINAYVIIILTNLAAASSAIDSVASNYLLVLSFQFNDVYFRMIFCGCLNLQSFFLGSEYAKTMELQEMDFKGLFQNADDDDVVDKIEEGEDEKEHDQKKVTNHATENNQKHGIGWDEILVCIEEERCSFDPEYMLKMIEKKEVEIGDNTMGKLSKLCHDALDAKKHDENKHDDEPDEKKHNDEPDEPIQCIFCCETMKTSDMTHFKCSMCNKQWVGKQYRCNDNKCGYFTLCIECLPDRLQLSFGGESVKGIHDIHKTPMYYIYANNQIDGPYTCDKLLSLYVSRKFEQNKIYIMSAADDTDSTKWHELEFPENKLFHSGVTKEENIKSMKEYEAKYSETKKRFPELYNNLIENIFLGKITQINPAPRKIPTVEGRKISSILLFMMILGRILAFIMLVIVLLHILPSLVVWGCFMCIPKKLYPFGARTYNFIANGLMFCGMIITPIVVVDVILGAEAIYDEIQSWQIAYVVWGVMSFALIIAYATSLLVIKDTKKQIRFIKGLNNIILYIVGVDFGELDLIHMIKHANISGIMGNDIGAMLMLLMPPLAGLLPAAISGFIANFILQEKFELKCRENIVNENICFESLHGCCEVISSHTLDNSYVFMGGLASNILATWAIIRICGYILVNAYPNFSVHAKKRN